MMIEKEYLKQLKEEDYIAWDSLVNDPTLCGTGGDGGGWLILLGIIMIIISLMILSI